MVSDFIRAAFPWILMGLFVAISCSLMSKEEKQFPVRIYKREKMRKVVLFIAMSLDGYIADGNGGVAWLNGHGNDNENIDTYTEFTKDIDTVLMGWNTSHQVVTELSPQEWVYNKFTTYVLTHKECNSSQQIHFTSENPVLLLERLKQEAGKDIWICGGANLVQQLVSKNMIDKYYIWLISDLVKELTLSFGQHRQGNKVKAL